MSHPPRTATRPGAAFISRAEAEELRDEFLVPATRWKPSIWCFSKDGRRYLVKDCSQGAKAFRNTMGRFTLWREWRIYNRLKDLAFVPNCYGRLDAYGLVFEWRDGEPLKGTLEKGIPAGFFDVLDRYIDEMHEHGVLHLDLRHRGNVIVGSDGSPVLLDFEAAIYLGKNRFSRAILHPLFAWADRSAATKYRMRYAAETVSPKDARRHHRLRWWGRFWPSPRIWPPPGFREGGSSKSNKS
ncbi:MAG: hypothetical protein ACYTG5_19925 [Planctomycetota bacterium]